LSLRLDWIQDDATSRAVSKGEIPMVKTRKEGRILGIPRIGGKVSVLQREVGDYGFDRRDQPSAMEGVQA